MSTIPTFDGFELGDRHARARELAARNGTGEETIAGLRAELADMRAREASALDAARYYAALVDDLQATVRRLGGR